MGANPPFTEDKQGEKHSYEYKFNCYTSNNPPYPPPSAFAKQQLSDYQQI